MVNSMDTDNPYPHGRYVVLEDGVSHDGDGGAPRHGYRSL